MTKYLKKILAVSLFISFTIPTLLTAQQSRQIVKIGIIAPLTGGLAARGSDIVRLSELVEDSINSKSTKYSYDFVIEDGKCGAGNASTNAANKLIHADKISFLITACSGETLQAGLLAEKNRIPTIAVLSLHKDIKNLGDYIFRNFIDSEKSFSAFAEFMGHDSDSKIAILTEENAFTFGVRDIFLAKLGKSVVYSEDFSADSADFAGLLLKIKQKNPNGIYLNVMSEGTLASLVNQIRRMGLKQKIYTYNMPEIESFRLATGSNSNDIYFIGTPEFSNQADFYDKIKKDYFSKYPEGPSYEFVLRTTFDAMLAFFEAAESAGIEPAKVKDFLYSYDKDGALGKIKYDQNGDIINLHYVIRRMRADGKHEVYKELVPVDTEN